MFKIRFTFLLPRVRQSRKIRSHFGQKFQMSKVAVTDGSHISKKRKVSKEVRFQFFEDLPDELLERILTMMFNAKNVRFVCHKWLGIVSNFSFLRSVCLQRWGEDSKLLKYEKSSPEKKIKILEKYFIPLVKDENGDAKVDWNRYYKIRSNYEKFLWLARKSQSSKLKIAKLKNIIGRIHMGNIEKSPEVSYRALKLLCDLARMYIEAGNIAATEYFVVQTWSDNDSSSERHAKYNTKMCACLFELYYIAKRSCVSHLQVSLILKIVNRFVVSSCDPKMLVKLMKELPCSEPKILHDLQAWYTSGINPPGYSKDEKGIIPVPPVIQRTKNTPFEATKRLFDAGDDFEAKKSAIITGMLIAEKKDPEFNSKLFRLVADLAQNEKFEEKPLPLLAKLAMEFPQFFNNEDYNILLELTLRRQKILLCDPIQQFYVASALLDSLNETRVQFFNEDDLQLLHQALIGHNLHEIETNDQTKHRIWLLPRLLLFEDRLIPYMPQYDRFFLEGQTSNPALAACYLCDILGKVCPDQAVKRITNLIEQKTSPNLCGIIAEGYDRMKTMLGDLWTIEYDKIVIELLLDLFPEEKTTNIKLKKKKIDKKTVKGKWIFPIKDVMDIDLPWEHSTKTQEKAIMLLMKCAKSHPMDRSTQIRILNITLIYSRLFSAPKEFTELFLAMPILHGEDIEDIAPQMLNMIAYNSYCNSEILLRLVNLHPCAVLIRLKQNHVSGMNSILNMAIIGCYYGIHAVDSRMSKEAQLEAVKKILLNKEPVSPTMKNILTHYAIQLRCAIFDPVSTSYCAYRERDYWAVMKPALKDSLVEQWILQFIDDYDPETNFLKTMIPQYKKKKNN